MDKDCIAHGQNIDTGNILVLKLMLFEFVIFGFTISIKVKKCHFKDLKTIFRINDKSEKAM